LEGAETDAEPRAPRIDRARGGDAYKAYRKGTHRIVAPTKTLERVRPFLCELGITRIANVTGLDRIGIPVVMVCRPNARSLAVSQGKGLDLEAAKASGLMESVETYHAEHISLPLLLGSYAELCRIRCLVDVAALPSVLDSRFHPDLPLLWIEGKDLLQEAPTWLPYEVVHANYTLPFPTGSGCFTASTNGLASGNHRLEAISHGICEVIERDATTLWRRMARESTEATGLDLDTVDDAACREALARFAAASIDVKVWETTSDVGVASFYCLIVDAHDAAMYTADGTGCHLDRGIALLRALTEAAQARMTYIVGSREDLSVAEYGWWTRRKRRLEGRGLMAWHAPARSFQSVPTFEVETFEEDLAELLWRLRSVGVEQAVVVDLTNTAYQLPVVRSVIPGLEGPDEHAGYLPGTRAKAIQQSSP